MRKRIKKKVVRRESHEMLLWRWQGGLCWICKQPIDLESRYFPEQLSIDHIQPTSRGGTSDLSNKAVAHVHCNSKRGNPERYPSQRTILLLIEHDWDQQGEPTAD